LDSSIIQGPFSVAPVPNPNLTIRDFCVAVKHLAVEELDEAGAGRVVSRAAR
jgi:hypothetical protein